METITKVDGMGAIFTNGITTFRVWGPNANKVYVTGSFNNWNHTDIDLDHEENGFWSVATNKVNVGDEYKFCIINGDEEFLRNDPYAYEMTNSNGNSVITDFQFDWEDDDFEIEDFNKLIIYELHVGTFNRQKKDAVGTFEDVIDKLPYLESLGINAIELLPVAEFPGGISWGYNPAAPFAIEQDYGGAQAFANLVNEAHKVGIAVIMDVVYNHFGPSDVDLWQFDGWSENDKGGIYFYNNHRSKTPWGDTRPDYGRPEVRQYIKDNALMWLEKYHCDGLRIDATAYIRFEEGGLGLDPAIEEGSLMMREINGEIRERHPKAILIAEDLKGHVNVTESLDNHGLGFSSQWDTNFVHPVREVLEHIGDEHRDLQKIVNALTFKYNFDAFERVVYTESHDEVANGKARVPEEIQPGKADSDFAMKRAILGIVLVMTAPGIPMIFQGQEFIEDEYFEDTKELDWNKMEAHSSILKSFRRLTELRKGSDGCLSFTGQYINIVHYNQETKILAYRRSMNDDFSDSTTVILNFSNKDFENYEIGFDTNQSTKLLFNSVSKEYSDKFSDLEVNDLSIVDTSIDNFENGAKINIPAYAALII